MFMGAETARPLITTLVKNVAVESKPRFSHLKYNGFTKLTRLPKRSAIVAFSVDDVYRLAEIMRAQKGGTAIVLGALSPRTRNAQVAMYQSGEVDYLVATDAIDMGLNMDINHIAFAATRKFDGVRPRQLEPAELAQIAGRAGRHTKDGTFGVTGNIPDFDQEDVEAIETHTFPPLESFCWRNTNLEFNTPHQLLRSLEVASGHPALVKGYPADDYKTLTELMAKDSVMALADNPFAVRTLWDVCQIPDFRKALLETHSELAAQIYERLIKPRASEVTPLDNGWIKEQVSRIDSTEGDIDTLMARISHIRTWTYITHRSGWVRDNQNWQERTRAIEDRLSDALHEALTKRFVDRRSAILLRSLKEGNALLAGIQKSGKVIVEGHEVGVLQGFEFIPDETALGQDRRAILTAARTALKKEIQHRVMTLLNAQPTQFKLSDDGQILYQVELNNPLPGLPVAKIMKGTAALKPDIVLFTGELLENQDAKQILEHLKNWLDAHIKTTLKNLTDLENTEALPAQARGIAFQMYENWGVVPRASVDTLLKDLPAEARPALRNLGVRLGPLYLFLPLMGKPAAVKLKAQLYNIWHGKPLPAVTPKDGSVSIVADAQTNEEAFYQAIGYPVFSGRATRIDMLDRVVSAVYDTAKDNRFQAQHAWAEWLGCGVEDLYNILAALGHKREEPKAEEAKTEEQAAQPIAVEEAAPAVEAPAAETPVTTEAATAEATPQQPAKPALAWFQLRRGLAHKEKKQFTPRHFTAKRDDKNKDGNKEKPKFKKKKFDKKPERNRDEERTYKAEAKQADSPFAVLKQLQK
ncbi:MAG: helicase [Alphaproteobacteria bacterium]|nr:helicase [Alphaproteobacteria bacterium]